MNKSMIVSGKILIIVTVLAIFSTSCNAKPSAPIAPSQTPVPATSTQIPPTPTSIPPTPTITPIPAARRLLAENR